MFNYIINENSVILYWDLPEAFEKGDFYEIVSGNKVLGKTSKCHFETGGLKEDTENTFSVQLVKENGKTKVGEATIKTLKAKRKLDITKAPYFAVGDGKTINTKCIQKAIDDCTKEDMVYIPEGDFMTGSLYLHSDMELYIEKGGILHGTQNVSDYEPKIMSRFEGIEMMSYAGLLNIGELDRGRIYETCKNVRISGEGTIEGGGRPLAENVVEIEKVLMKDYMDSLGDKIKECETSITIPGRVRPRLINISCAQNVIIQGLTLANGASWNVHMIYSKDVVTCLSTFRSENVWNGDGWDPDSSKNCTLFGCEFFTGDDSVAIKSGKNPEGNIINIPCENIRVFDCLSHMGHGIAMGSEMSGGIKDVKIWNCDIENSSFGIHIKGTKKRGGYIKNIDVRHVKTSRILIHAVDYNDDGESSGKVPVFSDYIFSDVKITGRYIWNDGFVDCDAITIEGFDDTDHFIKNAKFKNVRICGIEDSRKQKISLQRCEGISFENVYCK